MANTRSSCDTRFAVSSDVTSVLKTWDRSRNRYASTADDAGRIHQLLAADDESLLLAVSDGAIVGTIIATWDGWRGALYRLTVIPERRRQGIGRELVVAGEDRLRLKGAHEVHANVPTDDESAFEFWRALGYSSGAGLARFSKELL